MTWTGTAGQFKKYRCVFCHRTLQDRFDVPAHEAQCDMRLIVRRQFAWALEKHRRWVERHHHENTLVRGGR